jgi:hypothetical protein
MEERRNPLLASPPTSRGGRDDAREQGRGWVPLPLPCPNAGRRLRRLAWARHGGG